MSSRSAVVEPFVPPKLPPPISPAQIKHAEARAADAQNRIADGITRFAGSMTFVYLHVVWFGLWNLTGLHVTRG